MGESMNCSGYLRHRYFCDRVVALVLFFPALPVLVACALWVRIVDGGPVLFTQRRLRFGDSAESFEIFKVRTFSVGHDMATFPKNLDGSLKSTTDSPDLLRGARVVRAIGLDEIPQLWNVLIGDMSLIGPRPFPVGFEREAASFPAWVRPGITGVVQVGARRESPIADRLRADHAYLEAASARVDLRLVVRTLARRQWVPV